MYKSEAISAMQTGQRITHRFFSDDEFITMKDGKVVDEKGYTFDPDEFWMERTGKDWETDWSTFDLLEKETKEKYLNKGLNNKIEVLKSALDEMPDAGMILTIKSIKDKDGDDAKKVFSAGFGGNEDIVNGLIECMQKDNRLASMVITASETYKGKMASAQGTAQGQNGERTLSPEASAKIKEMADNSGNAYAALVFIVSPKPGTEDTARVESVIAGNAGDLRESIVKTMQSNKDLYNLLMDACAMATFGDK